MKKGLIFATTLAMALGVGVAVGAHQGKAAEARAVVAGEKVYLHPGLWDTASAWFAMYTYGGSAGEQWTAMAAVDGAAGYYSATVPENSPSCIFVRMDPSKTISDGWNGKWNQSPDLSFQADKNLYNVTEWSAGEWSTYAPAPSDVPAEDGYYLVGTETNWKFEGAPKLSEGTEGNTAQLKGYSASDGEEFKIRGYFDGVDTWYSEEGAGTGDNYVVNERTTVDIYLNGEKKLYVYVPEDVPAEPGYYIQGIYSSVPSWRYEHAMQMVQYSQDGNVAYYMNFSCGVGDEIQIRSYFEDREEKDQWGKPGNGTEEYGEKVGDHFVISKAGYYDIYAKYVDNQFLFFVAEHAESYSISVKGVVFEGKNKLEGLIDFGEQRAYKDEVFNPFVPSSDARVYIGAYINEACTAEYTPAAITSGTIYLKFIKVGYYVISGVGEWKIENAVPMMVDGVPEGNKAEASVQVLAENETYSFVYYNKDGVMEGHSGLGEPEPGKSYSYAVYEDTHIKFTKTGTYAVYWSNGDNKIYLNDGHIAYCTGFLTATSGECKLDEHQRVITDVEKLKAVWGQQKIAFNDLDDGSKGEIIKIGFDGGNEEGTLAEQLVARYHYIVWKYGSEAFEDFIFESEEVIPPHNPGSLIGFDSLIYDANATTIIVITIAATSTLAFTLLLVFKKKRQK